MIVTLYGVGRNLNRAVRTCEAFGVQELHLLDCRKAYLAGNLFRATGRVRVRMVDDWPASEKLCALETSYPTLIYDVPWHDIGGVLIGGETDGLPGSVAAQYRACIPMIGRVSGLTVEAALAITLYEWRRHVS